LDQDRVDGEERDGVMNEDVDGDERGSFEDLYTEWFGGTWD
jgi:hypothetical protein